MNYIARIRIGTLGRLGVVLVCSLFALGSAPSSRADVTYSYTGNPFTLFNGSAACTSEGGECYISASFVVASPLPHNLPYASMLVTPLSFSITDGARTVTAANWIGGPPDVPIIFGTGPTGQIDSWSFFATGTMGQDLGTCSVHTQGVDCSEDYTDILIRDQQGFFFSIGDASNGNDPGIWKASTTPEPSSLILLVTGFFGVAGAWRWKSTR